MSHLTEKYLEIQIEDSKGNIFEVCFNRQTYWYTDDDYGLAIAGGQGVSTVMIEEDTAHDLCVKVAEQYVPVDSVSGEIRNRIEEGVDSWLKEHSPETTN